METSDDPCARCQDRPAWLGRYCAPCQLFRTEMTLREDRRQAARWFRSVAWEKFVDTAPPDGAG